MMEKENFDEEFKNQIKQVFEEYNDSTANEGWDLLREKYPEKKRRDGFFWWIFVAAALFLIALVFGLFRADIYEKDTSKTVHQRKTDTASANRYSSTQKTVTDNITADTINVKKTSIKTASNFVNKHLSKTNKSNQNQVFVDTINTKKTSIKTVSNFASTQKPQHKTVVENGNNTSFTIIKIDSVETKNQQNLTIIPKDSSTQKALVGIAKKTNPIPAKSTAKKYPKAETSKKVTEKPAIFSLEVYAGPHINYANGSNNQLGLGAGFFTGFGLGKNFKLSTGLGLMQNNLTYGQDIPSVSLNAASASYSSATVTGSGLVTAVKTPSLNTMNTNLLALDVPLNLVYNFSAGKNSIAVSAGISSNTFVKEAYDYHYSNSTNTTQNIKSFNNFNFAKTLNLAAGFAYPLGKNQLQVEPFLKYPLGGSGSQQLQFGSAGINLKMKIQSFKK